MYIINSNIRYFVNFNRVNYFWYNPTYIINSRINQFYCQVDSNSFASSDETIIVNSEIENFQYFTNFNVYVPIQFYNYRISQFNVNHDLSTNSHSIIKCYDTIINDFKLTSTNGVHYFDRCILYLSKDNSGLFSHNSSLTIRNSEIIFDYVNDGNPINPLSFLIFIILMFY